uniref:Uncharacterized protein n=1 Tax=Oryza sativa subsp. japonica TaxID=39947 RepID=Q6Z2Z0_ORYSJ|nr:hypothetical protein [Oryza sativa Japonica Group]
MERAARRGISGGTGLGEAARHGVRGDDDDGSVVATRRCAARWDGDAVATAMRRHGARGGERRDRRGDATRGGAGLETGDATARGAAAAAEGRQSGARRAGREMVARRSSGEVTARGGSGCEAT